MYEVIHLFSNYSKEFSVNDVSSNDSLVSAYTTINKNSDSLTVILVNRSENDAQKVNLNFDNVDFVSQDYPTLLLSGLTKETFVSKADNALKKGSATLTDNKLSLELPAKSITAILLSQKNTTKINEMKQNRPLVSIENGNLVIQNPAQESLSFEIFNCLGQKLYSKINSLNKTEIIDIKDLEKSYYIIRFKTKNSLDFHKVFIK